VQRDQRKAGERFSSSLDQAEQRCAPDPAANGEVAEVQRDHAEQDDEAERETEAQQEDVRAGNRQGERPVDAKHDGRDDGHLHD
jgi:hypothetical protein